MRGYGQTDAPPDIQDCAQFQLVGDMVGLVETLGYEQAVIAGNDVGAMVARNAAILRPDMFRAVIMLSSMRSAHGICAVKARASSTRTRAQERHSESLEQVALPDVGTIANQ
jgi:pimeloyl-ACP methyl ester carboxylesterase